MTAQPGYIPEDLDTLVSTVEAAAMAGVEPHTVRQWKSRNLIAPSGLDKYKRPLYKALDILQTEKRTRESMLKRARRTHQLT